MIVAILKAVVLANAGTPFLRAPRDGSRKLDSRLRGNDGLQVSDRASGEIR
jgi:hypothetical protein